MNLHKKSQNCLRSLPPLRTRSITSLVLILFIHVLTSSISTAERESADDAHNKHHAHTNVHDMIHDHIGHSHAHRRSQEPACGACLDQRMIRHYTIRGCTPVIHAQCKCPSRFRCPVDIAPKAGSGHKTFQGRSTADNANGNINVPVAEALTLERGTASASEQNGRQPLLEAPTEESMNHYQHENINCFYNGTKYELLSPIRTSDPCRVCICAYLADGTVGIECDARVECPAESKLTTGHLGPLGRSLAPIANVYSGRTGKLLAGAVAVPALRLECYDFYEHDVCCPRKACTPVDARNGRAMISGQYCNYLTHQYRLGERIPLMDGLVSALLTDSSLDSQESGNMDNEVGNRTEINELERENTIQDVDSRLPAGFYDSLTCMHCICTAGWNNSAIHGQRAAELTPEWLTQSMGESCRVQMCEMQFDPKFRAGCIPVYEDDNCCPVDFVCPARSGSLALKIRGMDSGSKLCRFEGRKYQVGSDLYLSSRHNAAPCIDCTCLVPPDFTCVRRKACHQATLNANTNTNSNADANQQEKPSP